MNDDKETKYRDGNCEKDCDLSFQNEGSFNKMVPQILSDDQKYWQLDVSDLSQIAA
jgi:hypothetical protein